MYKSDLAPAGNHEVLEGRGAVSDEGRPLVLVDGPQHPQVVTPDLLKGEPAGKYLPQDDAPAEDVALLAVGDALKHLRRHPGRTALVVCHDGGLVTGRAKVADLEGDAIVD